MKLILALIFFGSQVSFAVAKNPMSAPALNQCALSYSTAGSVIFDAAKCEVNSETHLVFRSGKYSNSEEVYIYNEGQFWHFSNPIVNEFYSPKVALVQMGKKTYCLAYDFNWL